MVVHVPAVLRAEVLHGIGAQRVEVLGVILVLELICDIGVHVLVALGHRAFYWGMLGRRPGLFGVFLFSFDLSIHIDIHDIRVFRAPFAFKGSLAQLYASSLRHRVLQVGVGFQWLVGNRLRLL